MEGTSFFAVLDLALPIAVLYAHHSVCCHVPGHYVTDRPAPRMEWFRQLQSQGRLMIIAGLPRGPMGRRCMWLCVFRSAALRQIMTKPGGDEQLGCTWQPAAAARPVECRREQRKQQQVETEPPSTAGGNGFTFSAVRANIGSHVPKRAGEACCRPSDDSGRVRAHQLLWSNISIKSSMVSFGVLNASSMYWHNHRLRFRFSNATSGLC